MGYMCAWLTSKAAGHAVSGLAIQGTKVPPSVKTIVRANDSDAATAQKQLLLTADVVIYDLLGNERATRDAVVQLAQQPYGGREVLFVAVSSPLVWAATRPSPTSLFTAGAGAAASPPSGSSSASSAAAGGGGAVAGASGEWGGGGEGDDDDEGEEGVRGEAEAPWAGAGRGGPAAQGTGTGSVDSEDSELGAGRSGLAGDDGLWGPPPARGGGAHRTISSPAVAPTFRAPDDVPRRLPAAPARAALAVEQLVMRAGRRGKLRTAVVCPGLLYGEGEDDLTFCNAYKAAWALQSWSTRGFAAAAGVAAAAVADATAGWGAAGGPPRLLVYGRGTNVLPTLHVADLAAYLVVLAGGLLAHLPGVVAEFLAARSLTPLRLLVTGPPLSGKTHLARRLAHRYGLSYINVPLLLAAVADPAVATAAGLTPVTDPALLRSAQAEVAMGPSGTPNPKQLEKEKDRDKDREGAPPLGWLPTGGRVSARTLGSLLAAVLADPRCPARCRGFVLDGFPRSAAQARAAFYSVQVDEAAVAALALEQSHASVRGAKLTPGSKSHRERERHGTLAASPSNPALAAQGALAALSAPLGGGYADLFDLPPATKLVPNPLTAPTHVIELEAGEEELRNRLGALMTSAEEAVSKMAAETGMLTEKAPPGGGGPPGAKKSAAGAPGGASGRATTAGGLIPRELALSAALGHYGEAGFNRRVGAYAGGRADDAADLRSRVAAAQAAWEAERTRLQAERSRLEAEASTLKAKRRRARSAAAAAAAAAAGGVGGAEDTAEEDDVAAGNIPDVSTATATAGGTTGGEGGPPDLPQHGGLMALSLGAGGAVYCRLANPTAPEGPMVTLPVQPPPPPVLMGGGAAAASSGAAGPTSIATTVAAAAAQVLSTSTAPPPPPLPAPLERSVEALLGPPHNLAGFPEPGPTPPAEPPAGAAGTAAAADMSAVPPAAAVVPSAVPLVPAVAVAAPAIATWSPLVGVKFAASAIPPAFAGSSSSASASSSSSSLVGELRAEPTPPMSSATTAAAAAAAGAADTTKPQPANRTPRPNPAPLHPAVAAALEGLTAPAEAVEAGGDASYGNRWRGSRGTAVRRYLLRHVVPVVTAALAEVALARTGGTGGPASLVRTGSSSSFSSPPGSAGGSRTGSIGPGSTGPGADAAVAAAAVAVAAAAGSSTAAGPAISGKEALLYVARALAAAAEEAEEAYVDPYSDPSYAIQLAKIEAKAAREAARAAVAAAKAERIRGHILGLSERGAGKCKGATREAIDHMRRLDDEKKVEDAKKRTSEQFKV
uniref:adenylate kinase n=1 Tax=Volvox carteri f. nagariensis TaxID=3068 RepID=D9CIW0_VOLCA|nr:FAP75f [Volvox carteri f. nagariensis]